MYPGIQTPVILGSDGAGTVTKVGDDVAMHWLNQEVVINPGWEWGENEAAQSPEFRILGMPDDGTFATETVVPARYLYPKPSHLDWQHAAALPLAGMTAYRALFTQGRMKPGDRVLVNGVGGGVATFVLQYAVAAGGTVSVTSSSDDKIARACQLGAAAGFNYTDEAWPKKFKSEVGAADLIIDSAGGDGYANLIDVAAPGGRIVNYGATAGPPKKVDLFKIFWKQLHIVGSTMGSPRDFQAMLDFVNQHALAPAVDEVFPLQEGNAALQRMKDSKQFGKIVLATMI
jgi:NADPH:quinone reductase-like Zn-dependent oxidoreductase